MINQSQLFFTFVITNNQCAIYFIIMYQKSMCYLIYHYIIYGQ